MIVEMVLQFALSFGVSHTTKSGLHTVNIIIKTDIYYTEDELFLANSETTPESSLTPQDRTAIFSSLLSSKVASVVISSLFSMFLSSLLY